MNETTQKQTVEIINPAEIQTVEDASSFLLGTLDELQADAVGGKPTGPQTSETETSLSGVTVTFGEPATERTATAKDDWDDAATVRTDDDGSYIFGKNVSDSTGRVHIIHRGPDNKIIREGASIPYGSPGENPEQVAANFVELAKEVGLVLDEKRGEATPTDGAADVIHPAETDATAEAVAVLGSALHDDWRNSFQSPHVVDGQTVYEPRVKVLIEDSDKQKWINEADLPEYEGVEEIMRQDIANTPYDQLDEHWQADNKAAAEVVLDIMASHEGVINLDDPAIRTEVGNIIHNAWMSRNEWRDADDPQMVPFDQLSADDQAKDINQIVIAQQVFAH